MADLLEVIHAVFVGDDDVEQAVGVHVVDFEGGADAGVGVEDVFGPRRAASCRLGSETPAPRDSSNQAISGGSSSPGSRPLWA